MTDSTASRSESSNTAPMTALLGRRLQVVDYNPANSGIQIDTGCKTNMITNLGEIVIVDQNLHSLS